MQNSISVGLPKDGKSNGQQQQAKTTGNPAAIVQQPSGTNGQQAQACPDTHQAKYDCSTISAIANVRQADAAEWFNHAAVVEIGVGLVTAFVAFFAAKFAKDAVKAARENLAHDKRQAKAQLRPWMCFDGTATTTFSKGVDEFDLNARTVHHSRAVGFRVNLINTGMTPALNLKPRISLIVRPMEEMEAPEFPPDGRKINPGAVGPQRPVGTSQRIVGPPELDDLISRKSAAWLFASVEYEGPGHEGEPYVTEITAKMVCESIDRDNSGETVYGFAGLVSGPRNTMT